MRNKAHDSEDVPQRGGPLTFESDQRRKPQAAERPGAPYTLREVDGKIWLTWKGNEIINICSQFYRCWTWMSLPTSSSIK